LGRDLAKPLDLELHGPRVGLDTQEGTLEVPMATKKKAAKKKGTKKKAAKK